MANWILHLTQKGRYGMERIVIKAETAAPLQHIIDNLKASDIDVGAIKWRIEMDDEEAYGDWGENDDVDE